MRKTVVYLVVLAFLGAGVWYVFFKNKDNNPFGASEAGFTVTDTANIGKIFISAHGDESVTLERTPQGWRVNKEFPVLKYPLNNLLKTINKQIAEYPVPEKEHNMVIKNIASNGIKVEVYDLSGDKIREFYIGGESHNFQGTYMLMKGAEHAYVVNVPGFEGYLTPLYSPRLSDWRDRTVFDVPKEDIRAVAVRYMATPLNSFTITQDDNGKVAVALDSSMKSMEKDTLNEDRVKAYLGFFKNVNVVGYTNGLYQMDSLIRNLPMMCTIDLTTKDNRTKHVDVYYHDLDRRSKNLVTPTPGMDNRYDSDRLYAIMNGGKDTAVIQFYVFNKIFRQGYEFYQMHSAPVEQPKPRVIKMIPAK